MVPHCSGEYVINTADQNWNKENTRSLRNRRTSHLICRQVCRKAERWCRIAREHSGWQSGLGLLIGDFAVRRRTTEIPLYVNRRSEYFVGAPLRGNNFEFQCRAIGDRPTDVCIGAGETELLLSSIGNSYVPGLNSNFEPRPIGGLQLALHHFDLLMRRSSLPSNLTKREICENREGDASTNSQYFEASSYLSPYGLATSLFGFVVFAYGYWKAKFGLEVKHEWLIIVLVFGGLLIFAYGFGVLVEGSIEYF